MVVAEDGGVVGPVVEFDGAVEFDIFMVEFDMVIVELEPIVEFDIAIELELLVEFEAAKAGAAPTALIRRPSRIKPLALMLTTDEFYSLYISNY